MLELGFPGAFADPTPVFFVLEFDRLDMGALDFGFGRGVRGFELPRDAMVTAGREDELFGGVGGLPVEGVRGVLVLVEDEGDEISRGFLNIARTICY